MTQATNLAALGGKLLTTGTVPLSAGGTGAANAADARTNLGGTATGVAVFTAADAAAARTAIGLGTAATRNTGRSVDSAVVYEDTDASGIATLITDTRFILRKAAPTLTDVYLIGALRTPTGGGGTFGFVNSAFRAETVVNHAINSFEWTTLSALTVNVAGSGEHVAHYARAEKNANNTVWAFCSELRDFSTNPTTGSLSQEIGMFVQGTDNNFVRHAIDVSIGSADNGTGTNIVTTGLRIGPSFGDVNRGQLRKGIDVRGRSSVGVDLSNLDISYADRALDIGTNSYITWKDGDVSYSSTGTIHAQIGWNNAITTWLMSGVKTQAGIGTRTLSAVLQINGTQYAIPLHALS
jgi:hypothetical protein